MRFKNNFAERSLFLTAMIVILAFAILINLNAVYGDEDCKPRWDCIWSECIDNLTVKTCTDLNSCNDIIKIPDVDGQITECAPPIVKDCIDKDYDGYGKGKDCFGKDIDDDNPLVHKGKTINKKILFILVGAIIIISIFLVIAIRKIFRNKELLDNGANKIIAVFIFGAFLLIGSYLVYATSIETSDVEEGGEYGYGPSLALDSNGKVHVVHYQNVPGDLRYCNNTGGSFDCESIKTGATQYTSLALDSDNKVHISSAFNLKLQYCTNKEGYWICDQITTRDYGVYQTAIAIDTSDKVHITTDGEEGQPAYFTNKNGNWKKIVLNSNNPGQFVSSSIAIDKDNNVHISYITDKLYYCYNPTQAAPNCINVDNSESLGASNNEHNSIAIDSNNKAHISYWDVSAQKLKYATNANGDWIIEEVSAQDARVNSIVVDANNRAHISYYSSAEDILKYCSNNNLNRNWQCETLAESAKMGRGLNDIHNNRRTAIKKGRIADSISFSDDVHIGWGYQSPSTRIVKYTKYVDYAKDWTPPGLTIIAPLSFPENPAYQTSTVPYLFTSDEQLKTDSCGYYLDSNPRQAIPSLDVSNNPSTNTATVGDVLIISNGLHTIKFECTDLASPGNTNNPNDAQRSFSVDISDATPPSLPDVTDDGATTTNNSQLHALFNSSDSESGIAEYQYQIREDSTTGAIIRDWTTTSTTNSVTATGLTLTIGRTYYFAVKSKNGAGLWSNIGYSDGIRIVSASDTSQLQLTIISPLNITYNTNSIWFNISSNNNLSSCVVSLDNFANNYTMSIVNLNNADYTNESIADGGYITRFWCNDTNNLVNNTETISFSINTSVPTPPTQEEACSAYNNNNSCVNALNIIALNEFSLIERNGCTNGSYCCKCAWNTTNCNPSFTYESCNQSAIDWNYYGGGITNQPRCDQESIWAEQNCSSGTRRKIAYYVSINNADCKNRTYLSPCFSDVLLPFFSFWNFISALVIIIIIYSYYRQGH